MATKMKKDTVVLRKISKPVISTDVMGNRNVEVRAVGAWVQAESYAREPEAVMAAEEEEQRLRQLQLDKQARLKQFQNEVRVRVNKLDKMKKQAMLETNYQASEHERNIVIQSAFSSQDAAKKDTSLVRPNTTLTVQKTKTKKGVSSIGGKGEPGAFSDQTNQVHEHVSHARKNLMSCKVITENYLADDLPGGVWKISKTRDMEGNLRHPSSRYTVDGEEFDILADDLIEKVKIVNNKVYSEDPAYRDEDGEGNKENLTNGDAHLSDGELESRSSVRFDIDQPAVSHRRSKSAKQSSSGMSWCSADSHLTLRVPNIYEGVQNEEEKRRARSQQAMYRRLFMDIEREQVKENLRRQEHRKRIVKLKKEKEEERQKEEQISAQLIEPRDPVTGETSSEAIEREQQERRFVRDTMREHERRVQKTREMERYIEALRQQLKDKVRRKKIELPPLCCCGETIWDTNPETCANNCFFYKNPKEYGRALQSMLDSSELTG